MNHQEHEHGNVVHQFGSFPAGLLVGGLAGAAAMLFLAPQSGKETRDQMIKTVEGAVAQVRGQAYQIAGDVREQAGELKQRGQDMV